MNRSSIGSTPKKGGNEESGCIPNSSSVTSSMNESPKFGFSFLASTEPAQTPTISILSPLDLQDAKKAFALKIAGALPSGGSSPAKIIHAFIQVKDYEGLDKYLGKHTVSKDVLNFALQKACIASNAEVLDVLATHGANVDFVDQFGTTALHFAMRGGGNPSVLLALLKHGMQFREWRNEGQTLLHWACQWGHVDIVKDLITNRGADIHELDDLARLPIHVAATYGRPIVLSYLIDAYSHSLRHTFIPKLFLDAVAELKESDEADGDAGRPPEHHNDSECIDDPLHLPKVAAAANYLDGHNRTPLHCASSEEATNDYPQCIALLLENGGDPMLQTAQGKTALDLAYEAGRARVLIEVLPTEVMVELLMRINDVVPKRVRQKHAEESEPATLRRASPAGSLQQLPSKMSFSAPKVPEGRQQSANPANPKDTPPENVNNVTVWRKILLNDDVELLEKWRDSLYWCQEDPGYLKKRKEIRGKALRRREKRSPMDFETSQGLTPAQRSELFFDCYENGTGLYSHVQSNFSINIKANDFLTVLRSLTGLVLFEQLTVDDVIVLSPLHTSILFLALVCGRFRVTEQLLRMRQFDLIPASVLVVLILRRLYKEPTFPEQVRCELQHIAGLVEAIAVDALTLISLKDNTPEKEICRGILNAPLRICGDLSLIDLFAQANCTNLLSLPICQRVLDERWRGVLSHLPNWIGFTSRFCPLIAIVWLERRAHKERAKALADFIAEAASYTTVPLGSREAALEQGVFDTDIEFWQAKGSIVASTSPQKRKRGLTLVGSPWNKDRSSGNLEGLRTSRRSAPKPLTIYDRLSRLYGWQGSPRLSIVKAIYDSPQVKFFFHSFFHLVFLITFTLVLLNTLHFKIRLIECCAIAYVIGYAVEEIRQMIIDSLRGQFSNYLRDSWNMVELCAIAFTLLGFWIRLSKIVPDSQPSGEEAYDTVFYTARVCYLFGLHLFCMRTLFITSISPIIGPRLKMMADMLRKDLVPLLIVFAIFIFSYGVSFQGLMYPNSYIRQNLPNGTMVFEQIPFSETVEKLISRAFYSMFEVSVALEEAECSPDEKCGNTVGNKFVILLVLIAYSVIVNLILINLLIALFSNTVSRIGLQSTAHWLADRYQMVKEYQDKSMFPPPLNLISIFFELTSCAARLCCCCRRQRREKKIYDRTYSETRGSDDINDIEGQPVRKNRGNSDNNKKEGEEFEMYRKVTKRKWNKKLRNSRRVLKLTHRLQNDQWGRNTEIEAVLQFILVQSFALKDRRYTLGSVNAPGSSGMSILSTGSIEHRLLAMEKRLDEWMPKLLEELKALRGLQRYPLSPPDYQQSQIIDTVGAVGSVQHPHETTGAASTSRSSLHSTVTQPRDLLYRRPVSKL